MISQLDVKKKIMKQHRITEKLREEREWITGKSMGRKKRNQCEDRITGKMSFAVQQRNRNVDT